MHKEEFHMQSTLVYWLRQQHPRVLFTISPQGMKLPISVAVKIKRLGYGAGTPDLMIFEPRGGCHGLFIELKTKKSRVSPEQAEWLEQLTLRGYAATVCRSVEEAIMEINNYLK